MTAPKPSTASTAAATANEASRKLRRWRMGTTLEVSAVTGDSGEEAASGVSGGSGRTVLMPESTEARRLGGGVSADSSAISAAASRRLATSAWQSRHPGRCFSKSSRSSSSSASTT